MEEASVIATSEATEQDKKLAGLHNAIEEAVDAQVAADDKMEELYEVVFGFGGALGELSKVRRELKLRRPVVKSIRKVVMDAAYNFEGCDDEIIGEIAVEITTIIGEYEHEAAVKANKAAKTAKKTKAKSKKK